MSKGEGDSMLEKVGKWLETEGYPLEFQAANILRKYGFHSVQGVYVQDGHDKPKREVDVLATMARHVEGAARLRVAMVVECKWSGDKPWVIFTSPTTRLAPAACVSQTIASRLGEAAIWLIAGDEQLHGLQLFSTPEQGGFGGRQAFTKGNDLFYSAVQAAVGNCKAYAEQHEAAFEDDAVPGLGVLAFPIVLIEGELIRAYYDADSDSVKLEPVPHIRCHWKGSPQWQFFATVDVVSMRAFPEFAEKRAQDCQLLLERMTKPIQEIEKFGKTGKMADLTVTKGSRGTLGLPVLLHDLREARKSTAGRGNT